MRRTKLRRWIFPDLSSRNIYCIGDNVCTDIFGANLYNKYLERRAVDSTYFTQKAQVRTYEEGFKNDRFRIDSTI